MIFNSVTFLFAFLPISLLLYWFSPKNIKNYTLFLISLFFYFWGSTSQFYLIIVSIFFNYFFGLFLDIINKRRKLLLILGLIFNLGILSIYKYLNFFIENINAFLDSFGFNAIPNQHITLPIGISFFTFQAISYLIDIYRREIKHQKNPFYFGLYIALFPQLIAGPIVRYHDIQTQITSRQLNLDKFTIGVRRFIGGLAKKVLIANVLAVPVDYVYGLEPSEITCSLSWFIAILYAFQIYFDFSGYSDMAIGLAKMFGFDLLENFNYPFISKSISELWRRWHISLSSWFRDYLYIPLGGNRCSKIAHYRNLMIVFLLCGFWHGASWNFVAWGGFQAFFIILEKIGLKNLFNKLPSLLQNIYAFLVFAFGFVLFRSDTLEYAYKFWQRMLSPFSDGNYNLINVVDNQILLVLLFAFIFAWGAYQKIADLYSKKERGKVSQTISSLLLQSAFLLIFFLSLAKIASQSYNPFIYFRF